MKLLKKPPSSPVHPILYLAQHAQALR